MNEIKYKLVTIDDSQFAVFPDCYVKGKEVDIEAKANISTNKSGTELKCISRLELKQKDNLILVTEISCMYTIAAESWEIINDKQKKLPEEFIRHVISIAIGTQRGIILSRTKDTMLHTFLLPPISLKEVVKRDLVIDICKES